MSMIEHFGQLKFAVANVESVGVTADDRSRAGYMPPCTVCSHLGVNGFADMLVKPYLRVDVRGRTRITGCCSVSTTDEAFDSPAAASAWWRARRMERHPDPATDSRRMNTLARLCAASLEAIE